MRKGDESTEKQVLDLNPQGTRRRERPKQTWKRTVLEEAVKCGKTRSEVKKLGGGGTQSDGDPSQMPNVPNGTNVYTTNKKTPWP